MHTLWFILIALMVAAYVLLDGFDLGAGTLHLLVARTAPERRQVLRTIGPVWDGNEVWLIAAGGALFCAFPVLYAVGFSGLYLPLSLIVWLLMLRAIAIEFHHHLHHDLWTSLWDTVFSGSSALLIMLFGVTLGNVVRGVPIDGSGYFAEPLWSSFTPRDPHPGILDWYTILIGLLALTSLVMHGAAYLAWKTDAAVQRRAQRWQERAWTGTVVLSLLAIAATAYVRPTYLSNLRHYPLGAVLPLLLIAGLIGVRHYGRVRHEGLALLASGLSLVGLLTSAVFTIYPNVLPASDGRHSLTIDNAAAGDYGLGAALHWWPLGMILAIAYFVALYWLYRGKVLRDGPEPDADVVTTAALAPTETVA